MHPDPYTTRSVYRFWKVNERVELRKGEKKWSTRICVCAFVLFLRFSVILLWLLFSLYLQQPVVFNLDVIVWAGFGYHFSSELTAMLCCSCVVCVFFPFFGVFWILNSAKKVDCIYCYVCCLLFELNVETTARTRIKRHTKKRWKPNLICLVFCVCVCVFISLSSCDFSVFLCAIRIIEIQFSVTFYSS